MCYNSRQIYNKSYRHTDKYSPYIVETSCGSCPQCQHSRVHDVLFRCDQHHADLLKKDATAVFVTLTFNDENLNICYYADLNYELDPNSHDGYEFKSVTTWNNRKLHQFTNGINTHVSRKYNYHISYIVTCERGSSERYIDDRGHERVATSRPHYHLVIWFVPDGDLRLNIFEIFKIITSFWSNKPKNNEMLDISDKDYPFSRFVAKNSPVGYVYNEQVDGIRDQHEALKYIIKYCFKDKSETLYNLEKCYISSSTLGLSLSEMMPRYRCSNGIGKSFFEKLGINPDDDLYVQVQNSDPVELADSFLSYRGSTSDGCTVRIPRYYMKRLCSKTMPLLVECISDPTVVFNGRSYDYKYRYEANKKSKQDPFIVKNFDGSSFLTYHGREKTVSTVVHTSLYNVLNDKLRMERAKQLFDDFRYYSEVGSRFLSDTLFDFSYLKSYFSKNTFIKILSNIKNFKSNFVHHYNNLFDLDVTGYYKYLLFRIKKTNFVDPIFNSFKSFYAFSSAVALLQSAEFQFTSDTNYKNNLLNAVVVKPQLFRVK